MRFFLPVFAASAIALSAAEPDRADENWWSLQPLQQVAPPAVDRPVRNPIDAFIIAGLNAKGLSLSPEADRRILVRRLYFDLLGLPPKPEEVAAFVADKSTDAYEKLVDRLLESPHYGERWARHWLDVVRFGESHGFEYNQPRQNSWHYRNWVVEALNADMPYDQFVKYQVAGDVFGEGDGNGVIATGFLVAGPHNTTLPSSNVMKMTMRQDEVEDIIASVSQTFLGLTANCARCHDHKFDPITQVDYYRLAAALSGINHGERKVHAPASARAKAEIDKMKVEWKKLRNMLRDQEKPLREAILAEREKDPSKRPAPPQALSAWDFTRGLEDAHGKLNVQLLNGATRDGQGLHLNGDRAFAKSAPLQVDLQEKTLEAWVKLADLGQKGGGAISVQTRNGNTFDAIVFGEQEPKRWMAGSNGFARTRPFGGSEESDAVKRPVHVAIVYGKDGTITAYRDGKPYGKPYKTGLQAYKANDAEVIFGLRHGGPGAGRMLKGVVTRANLYDRALNPDEVAASAGASSTFVADLEILARLSPAERAEREARKKRQAELDAKMASMQRQDNPFPVYTNTSKNPGAVRLLKRGSVRTPGDEMLPGGIAGLKAVEFEFGLDRNANDAKRREKLAEWITHPDNPLFARVMANRLWHYHFGTGIVKTPNDFGFGGGRPSHPELLNWLAVEFKAQKWSIKAMHRLLVNSATYRQVSTYRGEAAAVDAGNRLLWRMSPRRLEAEELRDAMLFVSGKLVAQLGGPGYRDLREYKFKGSHFYDLIPQDKPEQFRRTLYRFSPRGARRTMLDTFDCPDPSAIAPARATTTTPLQSLALMNNELVLLLADAFAQRLETEAGKDVDARLRRAHGLVYGRAADPDELKQAREFVSTHGMPAYARVLFNSNEFLHVR